jgi:hypothetical protein
MMRRLRLRQGPGRSNCESLFLCVMNEFVDGSISKSKEYLSDTDDEM